MQTAKTATPKAEEKKLTYLQRISRVQEELKAPKSRYNSFGDFNYRCLEDILEGVKPLLLKYDLTLLITDEPVVIGEWHYIKATASLYDSLTDRMPFSVVSYAREPLEKKKMDDSQATGTASSYARKYALNGLFLIDDTKDADTDEYHKQTTEQPQKKAAETPKTIGEKEIGVLEKMLRPNQKEWVIAHCNVKSLAELSPKQYTEIVNGLKRNETKSEN